MASSPVILITGASSGLGYATAVHLAGNGYTVLAGVRAEQDVTALNGLHIPGLRPVILDVTRPEDISRAITLTDEVCGPAGLFALINNAGINYVAPFELSEDAQVRKVLEVNLFGVISLTRALLPALLRYGKAHKTGARILNIGSIGSAIGLPWEFSYHASKFAVLGMSQSLRFELAPLNVHVTCIMPGGVKTRIFEKSRVSGEASTSALTGENAAYYTRNLSLMEANTHMAEQWATSAAQAARVISRTLRRQRPGLKVLIGPDARMIYSLVWLGLSGIAGRIMVQR
ncbi:MAG: SDR family oxidoreductase [Bacteroidia bacterium]|nr:SDR family oxidoreductase [Bacteroidia bacterium]